MSIPASTSAFVGRSPSPVPEEANGPRLATHLDERVYIEARDLLKNCFERTIFSKFPTFLQYLPRLTLAQLEALDKVRCNLFRGRKDHLRNRQKVLKKFIDESNSIPWYKKYRLSGGLVCGGAAVRALTFLLQGNSFVAIARVLSMVPIYSGALIGAVVKAREIYFSVLYKFTKLGFPKARNLNNDAKFSIEIFQQEKLGVANVEINANRSPAQRNRAQNDAMAGPSNDAVGDGPVEMTNQIGAEQVGQNLERPFNEQPVVSRSALVSNPAGSLEPQRARAFTNDAERARIAEFKLEQVIAQLRLLGTDVRIHEEVTP